MISIVLAGLSLIVAIVVMLGCLYLCVVKFAGKENRKWTSY